MTSNQPLKRAALAAFFACCLASQAAGILQPGDTVFAIDLDIGTPPTSPTAEGVVNVLDGNSATKFLSGGNNWSGFIVTPGTSTVQSMRLTTAGDAAGRDPAHYVLYGTTDAISSTSQSRGLDESWTQISSGTLSLPTTRLDATTVITIPNGASYSSYKLLFPATRGNDANMQIADVQFYSEPAGAGSAVLNSINPIIPVDHTGGAGSSRHPTAENPANLLDGNTATKYLNFGKVNSGFIVVPQSGPSVAGSFQMWTANDAAERDPASYSLYGANSLIDPLSLNNINSSGDGTWTLISSGPLTLPTDRMAAGDIVSFVNNQSYSAYRFVVTGVRDELVANSMQFSDFVLHSVPEPSSWALLLLGSAWLIRATRHRRA